MSLTASTYDPRNLPLSLTSGGVATTYRYDDGGQAIVRSGRLTVTLAASGEGLGILVGRLVGWGAEAVSAVKAARVVATGGEVGTVATAGAEAGESLAAGTGAKVAANTRRFVVGSSGEAQLVVNGLRVSEHAALRMTQRGIPIEGLERALGQAPFRYFHDGAWKTGFYDPVSRVFAGALNGELTTVIGNVTPKYIANLMKVMP